MKVTHSTVSLQASYKGHRESIDRSIVALKKKLDDHAKAQAEDPRNWGYVGDLNRTDRLLRELLECV